MANDEIKKVITVDLGNTSTSLKEYKQHIDDLRASLLQLDETSEEYQTIAQEITDEQNKLNEVMKVGKGYTDAAEGSYNQLAKTMSELKKQWRATTDEAERADLGKQILDINDKLKELDASTGNFQRNVGDYSTAFEKAFDKCLDGIKSIDGPIGELGGTVKNLIPVIQSVNKAAIGSLTGIKAAIASTGIGLLVVGVGELATHWEDVRRSVSRVLGIQDQYIDQLNKIDELSKTIANNSSQYDKNIDKQTKIMQAEGENEINVLKSEIAARQEEKEKLDKQYYDYKRRYDLWGGDTLKQMVETTAEERQKTIDIIENLNSQLEIAEKKQATIEKNRISQIEYSMKSEEEKRTIQYEKDVELYDKYNVDKTLLTQKYEEDIAEIRKKAAEQQESLTDDANNREIEKRRAQAQEILQMIREGSMSEEQLTYEKYVKQKQLLEEFGYDTTQLTKYCNDKLTEMRESAIDDFVSGYERSLEQKLSEIDIKIEKLNIDYDVVDQEQMTAEQIYTIRKEYADKTYALEQEQYSKQLELIDLELNNFNISADKKLELNERKDQLLREQDLSQYQYNKQLLKLNTDLAKQRSKETAAAIVGSTQVMGDMFDNISKLAKEGSKESKTMAIMAATINAFGSAVGAYKSASEIPYVGWIMAPIAAASALAAGMANVKQIKATSESSSGSDSAASSTTSASSMLSATMAEVSPLLNEQNDLNRMTTLSETGESSKQQNMRVYVVDQDIRDANAHAASVEENATF